MEVIKLEIDIILDILFIQKKRLMKDNKRVCIILSLYIQERQKVHCLNTLFGKLRINQVNKKV